MSYLQTGEPCERVCANVALPTHKLWQIKTFAEMKNFLSASFPQFPMLSDVIDDEEINRFVNAPVRSFPTIQYITQLYSFHKSTSMSGSTGILALGR